MHASSTAMLTSAAEFPRRPATATAGVWLIQIVIDLRKRSSPSASSAASESRVRVCRRAARDPLLRRLRPDKRATRARHSRRRRIPRRARAGEPRRYMGRTPEKKCRRRRCCTAAAARDDSDFDSVTLLPKLGRWSGGCRSPRLRYLSGGPMSERTSRAPSASLFRQQQPLYRSSLSPRGPERACSFTPRRAASQRTSACAPASAESETRSILGKPAAGRARPPSMSYPRQVPHARAEASCALSAGKEKACASVRQCNALADTRSHGKTRSGRTGDVRDGARGEPRGLAVHAAGNNNWPSTRRLVIILQFAVGAELSLRASVAEFASRQPEDSRVWAPFSP